MNAQSTVDLGDLWDEPRIDQSTAQTSAQTARDPNRIDPASLVSVVRLEEGKKKLEDLPLGLIVHSTVAGEEAFVRPRLAQAETILEKEIFRHSFTHRRCIVVVDGLTLFADERAGGAYERYQLKRFDNDLFALAAIWDIAASKNGPVRTCAVITTAANDLLSPIRKRMPAILSASNEALWFDHTLPVERVRAALIPYSHNDMRLQRVDRRGKILEQPVPTEGPGLFDSE